MLWRCVASNGFAHPQDRPANVWGGAMMFRASELRRNIYGLTDAWRDGGCERRRRAGRAQHARITHTLAYARIRSHTLAYAGAQGCGCGQGMVVGVSVGAGEGAGMDMGMRMEVTFGVRVHGRQTPRTSSPSR